MNTREETLNTTPPSSWSVLVIEAPSFTRRVTRRLARAPGTAPRRRAVARDVIS